MGFLDKFIKKGEITPIPPPSSELATSSKKILVVEADEATKTQYIQILQAEHYELAAAGNGAEGLNMLLTFQPHLILLDLDLPVMTGRTMLHSLRAIPAYKTTPVVVISETGDSNIIRQVKIFDNANAFLIKGNTTLQQIVDIVNELLLDKYSFLEKQ